MAKTIIVLRNEIYALISRRSFWFGVLGVPAIAFIIYAGIAWINRTQGGSSAGSGLDIGKVLEQPADDRPQGYIDQANIIREFPFDFAVDQLISYNGVDQARAALEDGEISAYYVIPPDFIDSGDLKVYTQEFNLISSEGKADELRRLIDFNLLNGNVKLQKAVDDPLSELEKKNLSPSNVPARDKENSMTFFLPYAVMMLFYIAIMGSSGLLLNSVTKEKENKILEILMVSFDAQQLLLGKIIGLGLVGLFQIIIWAVSALSLLRLSGQTFQLPPEFQLDPSILGWGIVFFILGYLVYAALMAGIGALVPNLREASQATTIVVLPMMIPLFLISALIEAPNSLLTTILSIFPFTAPTTMMLRLAATPNVPLWQLLLAVALLIITAYLTIRAVAGFFRAQNMLSGQPFKIKHFALALIGKA
jgi:ABC-2 type transport system permease protein